MLIDSPTIMSCVFQRCRRAGVGPDDGCEEVLALLSDVLREVDQQGKFLIEVPDGFVPDKWVTAVGADTRRGIEYMDVMNLGEHDALTPLKRPLFDLVRLVVNELKRWLAVGKNKPVRGIGGTFQNIGDCFRVSEVLHPDRTMHYVRAIAREWDELSQEMREGCCRVLRLDLTAGEALISAWKSENS
jgi:hypothetical protein